MVSSYLLVAVGTKKQCHLALCADACDATQRTNVYARRYGNGKSERLLGEALRDIPREEYLLASKVGRYEPVISRMFDFRAERVLRSVDESLARLQTNYIDVIQVHDPEFAPSLDVIINETLPALEKVRQSGKARLVGVTGYPLHVQREIIERSHVRIDTSLVYSHNTMFDSSVQSFIPFLKENRVDLLTASPLGMGLLSPLGPPCNAITATLKLIIQLGILPLHCSNNNALKRVSSASSVT